MRAVAQTAPWPFSWDALCQRRHHQALQRVVGTCEGNEPNAACEAQRVTVKRETVAIAKASISAATKAPSASSAVRGEAPAQRADHGLALLACGCTCLISARCTLTSLLAAPQRMPAYTSPRPTSSSPQPPTTATPRSPGWNTSSAQGRRERGNARRPLWPLTPSSAGSHAPVMHAPLWRAGHR